MALQAFLAETLKYKRTLIPWLAVLGGFFPVFVALLFLLTSGIDVTWKTLAGTSLEYMNMLGLLLVAVFAGHTFVSEYRGSRVNMTFAYPVPRLLIYAAKLFAICLPVLGMYFAFSVSVAIAGWIFAGGPLAPGFAADYIRLVLLVAAANLTLVPVTAAVSVAVKNAGAYILAGVGYFIAYMSFAGSEASRYVPPCVPDRLLKDYIAAGQLVLADTGSMLLACALVFLLALCLGAVCYTRLEI